MYVCIYIYIFCNAFIFSTLSFFFCNSSENAENMHYFSSLALTLNEPEDGVAPTDSRLRPDQRLMEAGLWDEANTEKQRLEECQRLERRKREAQANLALEEGRQSLTHYTHCSIHYWESISLQMLCPGFDR